MAFIEGCIGEQCAVVDRGRKHNILSSENKILKTKHKILCFMY